MSRNNRRLVMKTGGVPTSDGAGVNMTRVIGSAELDHVDPFLLLDVFRSDNPDDYIAGFPAHPHRGFETVTYMFAGQMRHKDSGGNEGIIEAGGVQWMTAGRGVIHSEMPEQQDGLMWGTQLWVNLPASDKMSAPAYREFPAAKIPEELRDGDVRIKIIAGTTGTGTAGAIVDRPTEPLYLDVRLPRGQSFDEAVPASHSVFVLVVEGAVRIDGTELGEGKLAILGDGTAVSATGVDNDNRILVAAARPLHEPVARGGPFVMNTEDELRQAFDDFRAGRF